MGRSSVSCSRRHLTSSSSSSSFSSPLYPPLSLLLFSFPTLLSSVLIHVFSMSSLYPASISVFFPSISSVFNLNQCFLFFPLLFIFLLLLHGCHSVIHLAIFTDIHVVDIVNLILAFLFNSCSPAVNT